MSEEEVKGAFDDLDPGTAPTEEKAEEPKEETVSAADASKLLAAKDAVAREERERRKQAVKKNKELEAELAQLKEAKIEEDEERVEKVTELPPAEVVRQVIQEENYKEEVVKGIRAVPGITRPMAEELQRLVGTLPKSGDPEADVRGALAYFSATRNQPVTPLLNAGFGSVNVKPKIPESAVQLGKTRYGLTDDDFSKHGGERTL